METGFRVNTAFHLCLLNVCVFFFSILWRLKEMWGILFVVLFICGTNIPSPCEKEWTQVTETEEKVEGTHTHTQGASI